MIRLVYSAEMWKIKVNLADTHLIGSFNVGGYIHTQKYYYICENLVTYIQLVRSKE